MKTSIDYPTARPLQTNRYAKILATGKGLPEQVITNDAIIQKYDLIASDRAIQFAVGIKERRWAEDETEVSDLLCQAARECIYKADISAEKLDRIIYTRLIGERVLPSTAIRVAEKLGMRKGIPAFDITAACSGFIHALDMAVRYIATGDKYVLVLGGDISSRSPNRNDKKQDTKTVFLHGDGVAGVLIGVAEQKHFFASYLYTDNNNYYLSYVPFGTDVLRKTKEFSNEMFNMHMPDGQAISNSIVSSCRLVSEKLLDQANLTIQDIDFIVTSDQTTFTWKAQMETLGVPPEKSVSRFNMYGNTVAAMSPLNLHHLIETGKLRRGMTVLMMAHGAGSSGGGLIFKY